MNRLLGRLAAAGLLAAVAAPARAADDPSRDRILVTPEAGAHPELDAALKEKATLEDKLAHINALLNSGGERPADQTARLHQAADAYHAAIAKADERIRLARAGGATPKDLAADPEAARLSEAQLRLVNEHIARIRRALDALSYRGSDAEKRWEALRKEMQANAEEQYAAGIAGLTAGLSQALTALQAGKVAVAKDNVSLPIFKDLEKECDDLEAFVASPSVAASPEVPRVRKMIAAMRTLDAAQTRATAGEALDKTQEAIGVLSDVADRQRAASQTSPVDTRLFRASAALGQTAAVFAAKTAKDAAAPFDTVFKLDEAGLLIVQGHDQDEEFAALSDQSVDRHRTELALQRKMADLEEEKKRLDWAVARSH